MNLPPLIKKGVSIGYNGIDLFDEKDIEKGQIGYSRLANGTSIVGQENGDWLAHWLVMGREPNLGDPIFIDISNPDFPIYTAAHGEGSWSPELISSTYSGFLRIIEKLEVLAAKRRNPTKMQENPMTKEEYDEFIEFVSDKGGLVDASFWEILIADEEAGIGPEI